MSNPLPERSKRIDQLRGEIDRIAPVARAGVARVTFGIADVDNRIGGGLAYGLHEVAGATVGLADDAAATLFTGGVAARTDALAPIVWVMARRDLYAPGLDQIGVTPARLLQVETQRDEEALAVIEDALRHGGAAVVVGEVSALSMTTTRRLQLAAEEGATMALILRRWRKPGRDPLAEPSSALTRWRIGCVPSGSLPVAGIGRSRWNVALVRQRGGNPHEWILEGCDAEGRLAVPAELGDGSHTLVRHQDRQVAA